MANLKKSRKRKHHIIYQTTNTENGKIYIGAHSTDNLDDGYLGSGKLINEAISKYGPGAFTREILFSFSTPEEMYEKEKQLVNEQFVARRDVYNIVTGGFGGFNKGSTGLRHITNPVTGEVIAVDKAKVDEFLDLGWILKGKDPSNKGKVYIHKGTERRAVDEDNIESYLRNGWSKGYPKSPTTGKVWIYSEESDKYSLCDKDKLDHYLSRGWIKKKWPGVKNGSIWINKDGKHRRVSRESLDQFLAEGWKKGRVKS